VIPIPSQQVVLRRAAAVGAAVDVQPVAPRRKVDYKIVPFGGGVLPNPKHIAEMHAELLPRSPLTKLGAGFMERFYYRQLPKQGLIFGAVAYVDGRPAGFVSATYDSDRLLRRAIRWNWLRLGIVLATSLPSPKRLVGAFESMGIFKSRESRADLPAEHGGGGLTGECLSIGVRRTFRSPEFKVQTGLQIGRDLMHGIMAGFEKSQIVRARLIVDSQDIACQGFFRSLGWEPRRRNVPGWWTASTEYLWIRR
jgi:ribosomal protein S18 acetylase RimI-like enzyme